MKTNFEKSINALGRLISWVSFITMIWALLLGYLESSILYWVFLVLFFLASLSVPDKGEK